MPDITSAIIHLKEAATSLRLEAYRIGPLGDEAEDEHFTIAEELTRIDAAIGSRGQSVFAGMADSVRSSYVEIIAALQCLESKP